MAGTIQTDFRCTFTDSETEHVERAVLIAVAGPTGSGKTESAILIARGLVGPEGRYCVIDTDNRRALNKKNRYRFGWFDMQAPYTPEHFEAAIRSAIAQGYHAIIIDHFSAEWDDEGGLTDIAGAIIQQRAKGDAEAAERMTAIAWKEPKARHKKLLRYMKRCGVPIILCLRAEPKIKFVEVWDERRKRKVTKVEDAGWLPITEKMLGYDMLIYALMMAENPGVPVHLKKLEPELEPLFPPQAMITEEAGRLLAAWAKGDALPTTHVPAAVRLLSSAVPTQRDGESDEELAAILEQLLPWKDHRDALYQAFGTRIWSKVERMSVDALRAGFATLAPQIVEASPQLTQEASNGEVVVVALETQAEEES